MNTAVHFQDIPNRLFSKTGGWYLLVGVFLAQLIGVVGMILGFFTIQLNVGFSTTQYQALWAVNSSLLIFTNILLIIISLAITKSARRRLNAILKQGSTNPSHNVDLNEQKKAWEEITVFSWKYGLASGFLAYIVIVLGSTAYHSYFLKTTFDQAAYSLMGGAVWVITSVLLATLLLENFLLPARLALVPSKFETQLAGQSGPRLNIKFQTLVVLLIIASVLVVGPIGYHQTNIALFANVDSQKVLNDLQVQSVSLSIIIILLGTATTLIVSRSISNPAKNLIDTFKKVEQGDLSQRAQILASDEIGELAIYFNRMVTRLEDLQTGLEGRVQERTAQLKAINAVGRASTSTLDPDNLLKQVANLITSEFGYYYAAIYLIDETGQWAELKEATGETGKVQKEIEHRLETNETTIVGRAIRSRKAQVLDITDEKSEKTNYTLLPYSKSEIVLPLFAGDRIMGVLDVHSTLQSAFSNENVETLQNMANQVAIALDNARLFQETRQRLDEMRNIQKQYLREAWIDTNLPQSGTSLVFGEAIDGEEQNLIDVPITLRDQIIGQISLEGYDPLSEDEQNWVQAIANQAALALENARLIEESQGTAMREKFVTEINNKIWASTSVDGLLQTALQELGQLLDATEATIELEVDEG